jgi:hypothetical protein
LFLAETRAWEVASVDECYYIDDDLMFIEDRVYDYRDDRCEVGFAANFDEDYD